MYKFTETLTKRFAEQNYLATGAICCVIQDYLSRSLDKWSFNVFHLDRITAGENNIYTYTIAIVIHVFRE